MALNIGQTGAQFAAQPRVGVGELARDATSAAAREFRLGQREGADLPPGFRRKADGPEETRTFNTPSAALRTLDRGVESARRIVPDVKDILDLARDRFTEQRDTREEQVADTREQEQRQDQAAQRVLPEPGTQLGRFFGQQEAVPRVLGIPRNPVGAEKPVINFSGTTQERPQLDVFA